MKKLFALLLCLTLFIGCCVPVSAAEYIPVHTEAELSALFEKVSGLLQEKEEAMETGLGETESMVIASAYLRAWGISRYDDATPEMIDEAYEALFNASLFLGLAMDVRETLYTDPNMGSTLFELSRQLLDQEYYDLLKMQGEEDSVIENAKALRDRADILADAPESLGDQEKETLYRDLWTELYLAAGLKTIDHTDMLPTPEDIFKEDPESAAAMIPNPMVTSSDSESVDQLLGFRFPDLSGTFGWTLNYYATIADLVAEAEYDDGKGGTILLRLSPSTDADISGVYNAEFYDDWAFYDTEAEIDKYQTMWIAKGVVKLYDETPYAFAVDTDNVDIDTFESVVRAFIEACRNSKAEK